MSDENRMHTLLGKLFEKNAAKQESETSGKPLEVVESPAEPVNDQQEENVNVNMDDSLFDELLAKVLADEKQEAVLNETVPAFAAEEKPEHEDEPVSENSASEQSSETNEETDGDVFHGGDNSEVEPLVPEYVQSVETTSDTDSDEEQLSDRSEDQPRDAENETEIQGVQAKEDSGDSGSEENSALEQFGERFEEGNGVLEQLEETDPPFAENISVEESEGAGDEAAGEIIPAESESEAYADQTPELDPDDAVLMSALGYTGTEEIQQSESRKPDFLRGGKAHTDLDHAFAYNGQEYHSKSQNTEIEQSYEKERRIMLVRVAGTALFAFLLFIYDLFGNKFGGALSATNFPAVNILISLQLLLLTAAFSYRSIATGIMGIIRVRPTSESITATAFLATVLYDILIAIAAPKAFTLYNFPAAMCFVMTVAADAIRLRQETKTFRKLSSFDTVCTIEKIDSEGKDPKVSSTYRLRRGGFAENYFRHVNKITFPPVYIYIILFVAALALVLFFISLAASRTFVNSLNVFVTVIQFALPSFAIISYVVPFFILSERKLDDSSVILHESDTQDYDRVKTIVLEEKEIFGESSIKINGIMNCKPGSDYFDAIAATSAILGKIGGTVSQAFRAVSGDSMPVSDVNNLKVFDNGAEGDVGGVHYVIGTSDFLGKRWIKYPDADNRKYLSSVRGGLILYIAADGETVLRICMQYSLESVFVGLVGNLAERNVKVVIRCRDPFITAPLVDELIARSDLPVYVARIESAGDGEVDFEAESAGADVIDGGLIADGVEWMSAVRAADQCVIYRKWTKLHFYICAATIGIGLVLAAFLGALGAVIGMSSMYIVLFQLLSIVPSVVMSRLLFD